MKQAPRRKMTRFEIGCLTLIAVFHVALAVGIWAWLPRRRSRMEKPVLAPPSAAGDMRAELRDLIPFKADFGPTPRFVGEIHNTGSAPIESPGARLTLLYKEGGRGETEACDTYVPILYPGERAPCAFRFERSNHEAWDTYRLELLPLRAPPPGVARPKLEVFDVTLKPPPREGVPVVKGYVRNLSGRVLKDASVLVSIYGRDGKIVGADHTVIVNPAIVKGPDRYIMGVGATGSFLGYFLDWAAEPVTCAVLATAESL